MYCTCCLVTRRAFDAKASYQSPGEDAKLQVVWLYSLHGLCLPTCAKEYRLRHREPGVSQGKLAGMCDMSAQAINKLEQRKWRTMHIANIVQLAQALGQYGLSLRTG